MKTSLRRTLKTAAAATMTAGLLAVGAAAASAHVHVDPDDTAAGGYTHLTFNVPNESPTAKTSKLEVTLPTDTPLTSVSVKPVEGWKAVVTTTDLPKPVTVAGATVTKAPSFCRLDGRRGPPDRPERVPGVRSLRRRPSGCWDHCGPARGPNLHRRDGGEMGRENG